MSFGARRRLTLHEHPDPCTSRRPRPGTSAPSAPSSARTAARSRSTATACWARSTTPRTSSRTTLLRAWRSFGRFERRSSVETWLYRIATNACLDELERRPRRAEPSSSPTRTRGCEDADTSIADPAARYALREGMELAFLTAIQRLPGRQRAILILRDVLGWTAAEVAELLDTTVTAVNSALQRARATIEAEAPARRVAPGRRTQRELLRRYVDAWERADMRRAARAAARGRGDDDAAAGRRGRRARRSSRSSQHRCVAATAPRRRRRPGSTAPRRSSSRDRDGAPHRLLVLDVGDDRITHIGAYRSPKEREAARPRKGRRCSGARARACITLLGSGSSRAARRMPFGRLKRTLTMPPSDTETVRRATRRPRRVSVTVRRPADGAHARTVAIARRTTGPDRSVRAARVAAADPHRLQAAGHDPALAPRERRPPPSRRYPGRG